MGQQASVLRRVGAAAHRDVTDSRDAEKSGEVAIGTNRSILQPLNLPPFTALRRKYTPIVGDIAIARIKCRNARNQPGDGRLCASARAWFLARQNRSLRT